MRRFLGLLVLAAAASTGAAKAGAPTPICHLPAVVDRMTAELGRNPYYTRLDRTLIVETPTLDPLVVRCAVCLDIVLYETGRFGEAPVARCEARSFAVRALRNGFVLHPLRP